MLLDEELQVLQILWTPRYLPYWIDSVYNPFNPAQKIANLLQNEMPTEEDPDEEWNTPYPPLKKFPRFSPKTLYLEIHSIKHGVPTTIAHRCGSK